MRANAATLYLAALAASASVLVPRSAHATLPTGYLDNAGCDAIVGWSYDPDVPATPIAVHIYLGGPAGSGAPGVPISANVYRDDLCTAIGSCEHGYSMAPPLSFLDGNPHEIHAYGINDDAGGNPELGNSPRVLQCPPTASGVRRPVQGAPAFDSWKFVTYWDLLPLGAPDIQALEMAPNIPAAPKLVQAEGAPGGEVWLVDGGARRLVSAAAATAWRFDLAGVEVVDVSEIDALVEGTPWRPRPVLVSDGGLYLIDDPQVEGQTGASSSGAGGSGGESSGDATGAGGSGNAGANEAIGGSDDDGASLGSPSDDSGGCGIGMLGGGSGAASAGLAAAAAACLLVGARRRRARAPR